jgi:hypothetical protein
MEKDSKGYPIIFMSCNEHGRVFRKNFRGRLVNLLDESTLEDTLIKLILEDMNKYFPIIFSDKLYSDNTRRRNIKDVLRRLKDKTKHLHKQLGRFTWAHGENFICNECTALSVYEKMDWEEFNKIFSKNTGDDPISPEINSSIESLLPNYIR